MFLWPDEVEQAGAGNPAPVSDPATAPPFHVMTGPIPHYPADTWVWIMDSLHKIAGGPFDIGGLAHTICDAWNRDAKVKGLSGVLLRQVVKP